jgi:hypothetical protein
MLGLADPAPAQLATTLGVEPLAWKAVGVVDMIYLLVGSLWPSLLYPVPNLCEIPLDSTGYFDKYRFSVCLATANLVVDFKRSGCYYLW